MAKLSAASYPKEKIERLRARFSDSILEVVIEATDDPILVVSKEKIYSFLEALKIEEGFEYNFLADLTAYDFNPPLASVPDYNLGRLKDEGSAPRFFVVYQLLSLQNKDRIRVKVPLRDGEEVPTVTPIWKAANWLEREAWDLIGIRFTDHPNLKRIMLDERWQGHPQRKDYPIKKYQRFEDNLEMTAFGMED
jgi:NADH-quinone oxidoreductase subunit C